MKVGSKEACAVLRKIRVSPQKLNLVASAIRGKHVNKALAYLRFCKKRVSTEVYKALNSAIANAENNHNLDTDNLFVEQAFVGQSFSLRRFAARGRGRGTSICKPFSHLTVIVREYSEDKDSHYGDRENRLSEKLGVQATNDENISEGVDKGDSSEDFGVFEDSGTDESENDDVENRDEVDSTSSEEK